MTDAPGIDVGKQFTVFEATASVILGILSALLLIAGMRREKYASARTESDGAR